MEFIVLVSRQAKKLNSLKKFIYAETKVKTQRNSQ